MFSKERSSANSQNTGTRCAQCREVEEVEERAGGIKTDHGPNKTERNNKKRTVGGREATLRTTLQS